MTRQTVKSIAQHIWSEDMGTRQMCAYIDAEWKRNNAFHALYKCEADFVAAVSAAMGKLAGAE